MLLLLTVSEPFRNQNLTDVLEAETDVLEAETELCFTPKFIHRLSLMWFKCLEVHKHTQEREYGTKMQQKSERLQRKKYLRH